MSSNPTGQPSDARPLPRGILLVVSSPSGAGKTTLCHRLLAEFSEITFSVSYTTRPKRRNEREGVDYHFVSQTVFDDMEHGGEFAEAAEVHGNRYGTGRRAVDSTLTGGRDMLLDIDWQGARSLAKIADYASDLVMVFVLPPTLAELAHRLEARGTDAPPTVERRLEKAKEEITHYCDYDYLIINDDLDQAYQELRAIYLAERCRRHRRASLAEALCREITRPV